MFKRDGLNYRSVNLMIDGEPFTATVITALNDDPNQRDDYGEKFYDIQGIKKAEDQAHVTNGTLNLHSAVRATPYQTKYVGGSSDKLTVTQKNRIVNQGIKKQKTKPTSLTGLSTCLMQGELPRIK